MANHAWPGPERRMRQALERDDGHVGLSADGLRPREQQSRHGLVRLQLRTLPPLRWRGSRPRATLVFICIAHIHGFEERAVWSVDGEPRPLTGRALTSQEGATAVPFSSNYGLAVRRGPRRRRDVRRLWQQLQCLRGRWANDERRAAAAAPVGERLGKQRAYHRARGRLIGRRGRQHDGRHGHEHRQWLRWLRMRRRSGRHLRRWNRRARRNMRRREHDPRRRLLGHLPLGARLRVPHARSTVRFDGGCGDGVIEGSEGCDDGNTVSGDGCSSACMVEAGLRLLRGAIGVRCNGKIAAVCGNGIVELNETCDDGNTMSGDGCSSTCQIEAGYSCPTPGSACKVGKAYCGDGILQTGGEQCDDGNTKPGDCCNGTCQLEPNCKCVTPVPALTPPHQVCSSTIICGDGVVEPGEACDDGNTMSGDGCSADCDTVESGFTCPPKGGACTQAAAYTCGNGIVEPGEQCDDGNMASGDGCSADCKVEPGYVCPAAGMACASIAFCGDGKVDYTRGEQCDDGNMVSGDGCSPTCQSRPDGSAATRRPRLSAPTRSCAATRSSRVTKHVTTETPWPETGARRRARSRRGGSARWSGPRASPFVVMKSSRGRGPCDDGNTTSGDGCSSTCQLEPGYVCTTPAAACIPTVCGDGVVQGSEQCDNGTANNTGEYGQCNPDCTLPVTCGTTTNPVGACVSRCGDWAFFCPRSSATTAIPSPATAARPRAPSSQGSRARPAKTIRPRTSIFRSSFATSRAIPPGHRFGSLLRVVPRRRVPRRRWILAAGIVAAILTPCRCGSTPMAVRRPSRSRRRWRQSNTINSTNKHFTRSTTSDRTIRTPPLIRR